MPLWLYQTDFAFSAICRPISNNFVNCTPWSLLLTFIVIGGMIPLLIKPEHSNWSI